MIGLCFLKGHSQEITNQFCLKDTSFISSNFFVLLIHPFRAPSTFPRPTIGTPEVAGRRLTATSVWGGLAGGRGIKVVRFVVPGGSP